MITSAKWNNEFYIEAVIDGQTMLVPNDPGNIHRAMIAEWEAQGNVIGPSTPNIPELVSSRQFFMMLELSGLTIPVQNWVASQNTVIQIAFERSATFVRADPMLQAGFAGLGVTTQQVDDFFLSASQL